MGANNKGGCPARVGIRFHEEIEEIKTERIKRGTSKERISTEKITDLIVRNKFWKEIEEDIINLNEEDLGKL